MKHIGVGKWLHLLPLKNNNSHMLISIHLGQYDTVGSKVLRRKVEGKKVEI